MFRGRVGAGGPTYKENKTRFEISMIMIMIMIMIMFIALINFAYDLKQQNNREWF